MEPEKKRKHDVLINKLNPGMKYTTKIIPYVMRRGSYELSQKLLHRNQTYQFYRVVHSNYRLKRRLKASLRPHRRDKTTLNESLKQV